MNRSKQHWKLAAVMVGMLGCQTGDPEPTPFETVEQLAVGSFCKASMPAAPFYQVNEAVPTPGPNAAFVVVKDWLGVPGNYIAGLGDLSTGTVTWARKATPATVGPLLGRLVVQGRVNVPNPPGPNPPWPIGTGFQARFIMEDVLHTINTNVIASQNAAACP